MNIMTNEHGDTEVHFGDGEGLLIVHTSSDGIIADLFNDEGTEVLGTYGIDWGELADRCH